MVTDELATPEIIERRKNHHGSSEVLELVRMIHDSQIALDKKLTDHMHDEPIQLGEEIGRLLNMCFPNGDPSGHKLAHEVWIQKAEESRDFWRTMRKELAKWGLIIFIGWFLGFIGLSLWQMLLHGPQK